MNLNLAIPKNIENVQPKISVIGVGGAGCNAVNTMINSKVNNINLQKCNLQAEAAECQELLDFMKSWRKPSMHNSLIRVCPTDSTKVSLNFKLQNEEQRFSRVNEHL